MDYTPQTVVLKKPLQHGSKEITELVFGRELVAGDLRDIPMADMCWNHIVTITSRICGYPPSVLSQLVGRDFTEVSAIVMGFLNGGQETGQQD